MRLLVSVALRRGAVGTQGVAGWGMAVEAPPLYLQRASIRIRPCG